MAQLVCQAAEISSFKGFAKLGLVKETAHKMGLGYRN